MKEKATTGLWLGALLLVALPAYAQAPREDVVWARSTAGAPITLDGILNESAWAKAESVHVQWSENAGIPGSGWKLEVGLLPKDPTRATLKFLVAGNQMYLAAIVPDSSVGGGATFNRADGLLMAIKDHADTLAAPKPPAEYFYTWWYGDTTCHDPAAPGKPPKFIGRWGDWACVPRDAEDIANWDAVTVVNGLTNSDAVIDQGYTVEMRFNLTPMGYDVTQPDGDVVEWNISIYDADWFWPINPTKVSTTRTWFQGPWGNALVYNEVRVFARPNVTVNSGPVPVVEPELRIPNGISFPAPVIDGDLSDAVWDDVPSFDIRWGDDALRETYPAVGPYRAGQFQPAVNGGTAAVTDPSDATVKIFFREDVLYFGFDVRDGVVQDHPDFNRWDGFLVNLTERDTVNADSTLLGRRLSFHVGQNGSAIPDDYLPYLIDTLNGGSVALALKGGTTVDTLGLSPDSGYTAELAVDLTKFGYPTGLGDRAVFLGINLLDGDSFLPITDSYGIRTWWFREYEMTCCPVWAHLDPTCLLVGVEEAEGPSTSWLSYNRPNPFRGLTTLSYTLREESDVTVEIFDVSGRLVDRRELGAQPAGARTFDIGIANRSPGVYFYRLVMKDARTGAANGSMTGKMILMK
jgi:hypothetical protein